MAFAAAAALGGCQAIGGVPQTSAPAAVQEATRSVAPGFTKPIVVSFDTDTGRLQYWPLQAGASNDRRWLSKRLGIKESVALAADGNIVAIANYSPPEIMLYNVERKTSTTLADDYGQPLDVAIGKQHQIVALNENGVVIYQNNAAKAFLCPVTRSAFAVAIDNEGDIFANAYSRRNEPEVIEYPAGSKTCIKPKLLRESGYAAGIAVDPGTDDLIVVDNPSTCAGGLEGRMRIYTRPYNDKNVITHSLRTEFCAGTIRLDATAHYILDSDIGIEQRLYPSGHGMNAYHPYTNGGFTTIPNRLPN